MLAPHRLSLLGCAALAAGLAASACRPSARADRADSASVYHDTTRAADRGMKHDSLTDGDIAAIVSTANTLDSASGALAATRAHDPQVRAFAQRMVREHGSANHQVRPLLNQLNPNATPLENDDIRSMRNDAEHARADLARDSGQAFDKSYIDHEVDDHQHLIDKLDHDLIPHAQNARLKALLTQTRSTVNAHLTTAKQLQDRLSHTH